MARPNVRSSRILIVDDVEDNLNLLTDMLAKHGHQVDIALSGAEALEAIAHQHPDLILLDIQMPGMDGYEVCERLQADEATRDIPVIFLSALSETRDIVKGFEAGGVDYVSKPFQSREVVARVENQLTLAQQRQEITALREQDRQQFQQINKMRDRFLHAAAHDLKNPLTGVMLYVQKLRSLEPNEVDELPEIADGIEQSSQKMQMLITDLLDLAQMQISDTLPLHPTRVQPILEKVLQHAAIHAQSKGIELGLECPSNGVVLHLDNHYFERAIDNLVSNALKYTPNGGSVKLSLNPYPQDGLAELVVSDSGIGIPEEDLPHIFEEFYRVRSPQHKKVPGTGLGLSIVKAIITQHGGEISIDSAMGEGTHIRIRLPMPPEA